MQGGGNVDNARYNGKGLAVRATPLHACLWARRCMQQQQEQQRRRRRRSKCESACYLCRTRSGVTADLSMLLRCEGGADVFEVVEDGLVHILRRGGGLDRGGKRVGRGAWGAGGQVREAARGGVG